MIWYNVRAVSACMRIGMKRPRATQPLVALLLFCFCPFSLSFFLFIWLRAPISRNLFVALGSQVSILVLASTVCHDCVDLVNGGGEGTQLDLLCLSFCDESGV